MLLEAFAKINLSLDITGVREDGYHLMDMLMLPVSLADEVSLTPASDITLTVEGSPYVSSDPGNLAFRAAKLLKDTVHFPGGVKIHVHKKIPVGAGLGGGVADAAAVLRGLKELWHLNLSLSDLETLGLSLGADVPFCIRGGLCRVMGIGEKLIPCDCPHHYYLVLLQPCRGLSTKDVFSAYRDKDSCFRPNTEKALSDLQKGSLSSFATSAGNVLQHPAARMCPEIAGALSILRDLGSAYAAMSGSGSAVFGLFTTKKAAEIAFRQCSRRWSSVFLCHTQQDSIRITS